jgi:predicted metal-dependent hydrolase
MSIEVHQTIRSKRKTLALIVEPDGSLIVRAPLRSSEKSIREFVENNARWIEKKQAQVREVIPVARKQYIPGEMFMYLGNCYPLEIVKDQKKPLLLIENFKLAQSAQNYANLIFERWYRRQAREVLNERVNLYASQHDFQYDKIRITSARSRWGSCSANGSLNFSWRLIMTPLETIDYVVIHELVHTIIHNHSKQFWKKMEKILPNYKEHKKWLRNNGQQFML